MATPITKEMIASWGPNEYLQRKESRYNFHMNLPLDEQIDIINSQNQVIDTTGKSLAHLDVYL